MADMVERGRGRSLSQVLRLVHLHGSLSRAAITEACGLNRSTVSDLVSELARRGLVRESDPVATNRAGRPSPTVEPDPDVVALAVNPETDAITTAWVGLGARVTDRRRHELDSVPSPETLVEVVRTELAAVERAASGRRVVGIGVAVPGLVRSTDGLVRLAPHLAWTDVALAELVETASGIRTVVENDAAAGATAEHLFGAGRGIDDLVYLNGGASGIGGGIFSGGRLVTGHDGYAGEFGQTRPRLDEPATLEELVSRARMLGLLGEDALTDDELEHRLAEGGAEVEGELARQARMLGAALGGIVTVLNPRVVVLGGYLATLLRSDPARIETLAATSAFGSSADGLRILPAQLGADRLLVGVAEAAFADLLADPARAP